jgi:hypothetical protein
MMGKIGLLGTLVFLGALLVVFSAFSSPGSSDIQQTGTTKMNVTIRGYVSIAASTCVTGGITFNQTDPGTTGNNATCNWGQGDNGGSGFNLTVDPSSTVNINFTHATNRTNLTDGTNFIMILNNVTTHSNITEDNGTNLLNNDTATSLSNSWLEQETCDSLGDGANCWSTYFLDVGLEQPPGTYETGYCWCGRQIATDINTCGTCT